ncbi:hypothetical protein BGM26_04030 [Bacillus sp. FJAT-29790]|uniref:hypothetical protein n=1 Tax=Bacillus sp. FJAT-29790 TaxID=1895002 RepID=UPI001C2474AA|nr:hypothetical protein [Bacillus sp. FJAT-29790]MBU8878161.1 hypothetical protein [Bacillus sp. FJAT-29790]
MNNRENNSKGTTKNKNDININNNFSLSINFGDSLNLFALIVGLFIIKRISKQYKINKKLQKENKEKND